MQQQILQVSKGKHQFRKDENRVRFLQNKIYPHFPTKQEYDVILVDPPWKYDKHTQKSNIPNYNTLTFNELSYLPIRRVSKQDSILLMWTTAPMLDKAISLIKIFGFRYISVFQNWVKLQNGQPAQIKSGISSGSSEFLLWAEKGRTLNLKTPDQVEQIIMSEITKHSEKPYDYLFPRLMQKLHLNKIKCLEVFARDQKLKYFDVYGDELQPNFQKYHAPINTYTLNDNNVDKERINEIMSKIQYNIQENHMLRIISQYHQAFALSKKELGKTPIAQHHIRLNANAMPVKHNAYRCSPKEHEFMEKEIEMLLKLGCIERCEASWVMPVIMVKKKDTLDLRMCIDYRSLNKDMLIENYPIPRVDYILTCLGKGKFFTKLDIKSGFWQIEIAFESQQYTGFITPFGTFRWKRMPFGLKNAPATFQRVIETALREILGKFCLVYIDDIVIYSQTLEEHIQHIEKVLELLQKADLKIGVDKCEFFQTHIDILGHHLSNGQVTPQKSKVQAIKDLAIPENRSQIRSFVGMCSYYRSFIHNFSQKCGPLLKLTQQKVNFEWSQECQNSFDIMKHELCTAPVLQTPNPNGKYILQTDFSEKGLGAVLNQILPNETIPRVIEYASRSLRGAEINYPAYEGEVLAVHWSLEKFRHYLHGITFTLLTDNKALQQVLQSENKSKKFMRWIMDMQEYDFITLHRPGNENANADALSRLIQPLSDINIKLSSINNVISYQTYSQMYQGNRMDENIELNAQFMTEGVGDLHCKICQDNHTKVPMLICERCGNGFHNTCLLKPFKELPQGAWYCYECLELNKTFKVKDITMDFECLDFLQNNLDISQFDDSKQHAIRARASKYKFMHNRLYYINNTQPLLVPTIAERKLLVLEQHRVLLHPSPQRLLEILKLNFYWSNMEYLIEEITYNCQVCQARKIRNLPSTTYIPTDKGHEPFHTVSMDLAPELTKTPRGNRHLLVMVDNFSKFVLVLPIKDKTSQTIADCIFNYLICTFGTPKYFKVDQGTEFKGDVSDLAYRWGIKMARITTNNPQANGIAENMIGVVKRAITAAVNDPDQPMCWDEACYPIQMSINAAKSRATSLSPYSVLFGKIMPIPQSIVYDLPLEEFQEPSNFELQTYVKKLQRYLRTYYSIVTKKRKQVDSYNKLQYEKLNLKPQASFQNNQLVFLKKANASRWALPNIGPFIFLKYTSKLKNVALIKNPATNIITKQSVANLSPWKIIESQDIIQT